MATPAQVVKNASKLLGQMFTKQSKEAEAGLSKIMKAVVSELNATLKNKPLGELSALDGFVVSRFEFEVFGDGYDGLKDQLWDGPTIRKEEDIQALRIKGIAWNDHFRRMRGAGDSLYYYMETSILVKLEKSLEFDITVKIEMGA